MEAIIKIIDIKTALAAFEEACIKHSEATVLGDYKSGNKYYEMIIKSTNFLKSENAIYYLKDFLCSSHIGVRLWSGCFWLAINEEEAIKILEEIVKSSGIYSLIAETTLIEWKKGNLKF